MGTNRLKSIDIIKGLAMVMIILVHYNQSFYSNVTFLKFFQMGCQMFFVASGFGVANTFKKNLNNSSFKDASKLFYISRIKSIAPAWYIMILVIYCVNTLIILLTGHTLGFGTNREPIAIICNLLFLNGLLPFCNNNVMPGGWYIGTIMLLYLISPLLYFLYEQAKNRKNVLCLGLSVLAVSVLIIMALIFSQYEAVLLNNNSFGYFSALTQFPCFALGMLLFFEINEHRILKNEAIVHGVVGLIVMVIAIALFFNSIFKYTYIFTVSLVGLSTYFLLVYMIFNEHENGYKKVINPLIAIGSKSFYVYLVHAFFAWTFVSVVKKVLNIVGATGDSYLTFFILMPIVVILSYYSGCILQVTMKAITKIIFRDKSISSTNRTT